MSIRKIRQEFEAERKKTVKLIKTSNRRTNDAEIAMLVFAVKAQNFENRIEAERRKIIDSL